MSMFYLGQTILLKDQKRPAIYAGKKKDTHYVMESNGDLHEYELYELDYLFIVPPKEDKKPRTIYHGPFASKTQLMPNCVLNKNFVGKNSRELKDHIDYITKVLNENNKK